MPDRWTVAIRFPAQRDLARLPANVVDAALRFVDGPLAENPHRVAKRLSRVLAGLNSGRVGSDFRILVRIDDETRTVHVYRVAHRANVYRAPPR